MDAAEASEDVDPVFQRARQAQETTLRAAGKKFVAKLGQKDYLGKRGLDGHLLCDKWSVELKWGERAGRAYASDAAPRGLQALPRGSTAMSEEDEYSSSGEGRALADAAGVSVWAVTRRKGPKRPVESQPPVDAEPEKGKRACGAKNRLQQTLGCEIVYRCQLCMHPMRAARQVLSLATHRNGKSSCVRAIARYKSTSGGGKRGPPCPGSVAAMDARLEAMLSPDAQAALHVSRAMDILTEYGYRHR